MQKEKRTLLFFVFKTLPFIHWTNAQVIKWAKENGLEKLVPTFKSKKITGLGMQATKSAMTIVWKLSPEDQALYKSKISEMTVKINISVLFI